MTSETYHAFISYAVEDQNTFVDPLVRALSEEIKVWYDKQSLPPGQSLRGEFDNALAKSKAGIVVASPRYFRKVWPQLELEALLSTGKAIIPVLYDLSIDELKTLSPLLAGKHHVIASGSVSSTAEKVKAALLGFVKEQADTTVDGILVVGSAHSENVLTLDDEYGINIGRKHIVKREKLFGGSGLNISLRLLNMGYPTFPLLTVGKGRAANLIRGHLLDAARARAGSPQLIEFIQSDDFFCEGINTTQATMAVSTKMQTRTSFIEELDRPLKCKNFIGERADEVAKMSNVKVTALAIGHIYGDNPKYNSHDPGGITRALLEKFKHSGINILCNFGFSQICTGVDSWAAYLRELTVLQLSMNEVRSFFSASAKKTSLTYIMEYLQANEITAVITLDRLGALCTFKDGRDGVLFAGPLEIPNYRDPTGAGDASMAGLLSALYGKPVVGFNELHEALDIARMWATYACLTPGGANECPTRETMDSYKGHINSHYKKEGKTLPAVEVMETGDIELILQGND